ncbi:hypothetical protein [Oribacterium sp. oral taxon 078]|uniref:hypothetical protein n=1 Tax=Oribacterium sp. oral taxon 078 TaxID=652706 RepID=UPI0012DEF8E7|nr:hypothetical protein [Oribacterium sp. oral taxon 078]
MKYVYRKALLRDLTEQGSFILSGRGSHTLPDLNAWKSRPIKGMALAIKAAIVFLKAGKSGRRQRPSMEAKRFISYPGSRTKSGLDRMTNCHYTDGD